MKVTRRMIVVPVATVMAAGIGAGAFAVGLTAARDVPEAVTEDTTFTATMDGDQEVTQAGVPGAGDLDGARGSPTITIDTATDEVCVDVSFSDVDPITLMHIHRGARRRQRTDRRGLRSRPGSGAVRHLRAGRRGRRRDRGEPARLLPQRPHGDVPGRRGPGPARTRLRAAPTCCRHRYVSTTPGCRTRSGHPRSRRTRPPPSTCRRPARSAPSHPARPVRWSTSPSPTSIAAGFATVYSAALTAVPATSTINWERLARTSPSRPRSRSTPPEA